MKLKLCTALLTVATLFASLSLAAEQLQDAGAKHNAIEKYGRLPLSFEPTGSAQQFLAHSGNYTVSVGAGESSVVVTDTKSGRHKVLRFAFDNANPSVRLEALEPQAGVTNYYIGQDPANWRLAVKSFAKLRAPEVYPGVDVVYYGDHRQLEFDFVIAPKADPSVIALSFAGMDKLYRDASGNLVAELNGKSVRFVKPYAYQKVGGTTRVVDADYEVAGNGKVQLRVGQYDSNSELIVDPVVSYATYLGGTLGDTANGIAVDSTGAVYVTGQTCSSNFPGSSGLEGAACAAFVTKYSPGATGYDYTTILGGLLPANATASASGIALDNANPPNAYIVGTTNIKDLPFTPASPSLGSYQGGDSDAFIVVLNGAGGVTRSSYLGGNGADAGYSIGVYQATPTTPANVIVIGQTCSQNFPGYNAFETKVEDCVAFITKLDNNLDIGSVAPGGSALSAPVANGNTYYFSEFFGGQPVAPYPTAGAWTPGTPYVAGAIVEDNQATPHIEVALNSGVSGPYIPTTSTTGIPVPNWNTAVQGITLEGTMQWEDLGTPAIPAAAFTEAYGVAIDPPGDVFVAGGTNTAALASTIWPCSNGANGAWILKVSGATGACIYEWTLESTPTDVTATIDTARAVAVDASGNAYVTGTSSGTLGTTANAYKTGISGGTDAFLVRVHFTGSAIDYSTYLGGSGNDQGLGVAVDGSFAPYVTGSTKSADFPTINPLTDPNNGYPLSLSGTQGAFITKFTPDGSALIFSAYLGGSNAEQGNAIAVAPDVTNPNYYDMFLAGSSTSPDLLNSLLTQPMSAPNYVPPLSTNAGNGDAFVAMVPGASIPAVTVMPGSLVFPTQDEYTTSAAQQILYTNTNSLSTVQIGAITFENSEFQQSYGTGTPPDCVQYVEVAPLSTCQILVIFTPTAQNLQSGKLTITDDASSASHVLNLKGYGAVPVDTISPTNLVFAATAPYQPLGTPTAAQLVTLKNVGAGVLNINSISIVGTNPSDFSQNNTCTAQLASESSCTISVIFTPGASGTLSATLTITDNAAGSPHTIPLQGIGAQGSGGSSSSGSIQLAPSTLAFGSQTLNMASTLPVTLTNTSSTSALAFSGVQLSDNLGNSDFTQTNNCPASLAALATCKIQVTFTPTVAAAETATLTVNGSSSPSVAITGTGGTTGSGSADFTLNPSNNGGESVVQGNQATFSVTVSPVNGFNNTITFICAGPSGTACSVSPNPLTMNGVTIPTVSLYVSTSGGNGGSAKLAPPRSGSRSIFLALLPFSMMGILLVNRRRRIGLVLILLGLGLMMGLASCGASGTSSSTTSPVAAGTYTVTLSGTSSGTTVVTHSATLNLVVNKP